MLLTLNILEKVSIPQFNKLPSLTARAEKDEKNGNLCKFSN